MLILVKIAWAGSLALSNVWLSEWTRQPEDADNYYYLKIYSIISITYGVLAFIRVAMIMFRFIHTATHIHNMMVISLLHAP